MLDVNKFIFDWEDNSNHQVSVINASHVRCGYTITIIDAVIAAIYSYPTTIGFRAFTFIDGIPYTQIIKDFNNIDDAKKWVDNTLKEYGYKTIPNHLKILR